MTVPQQSETARFLVADIGGTHARFALLDRSGGIVARRTRSTAAFEAGAGLSEFMASWCPLAQLDAICIAMAGPVVAGAGDLSNGVMRLREDVLEAQCGVPVCLVNDFVALAHWVPDCAAPLLLGGSLPAPGPKVVVGPGTGLGAAALLPQTGGGWLVLPSEAGHGDLAPRGPLELEVARVLDGQHAHLCWERVLSGPGMVHLYRALAEVWGAAPDPRASPEWITGAAVDARVPLCHQTVELFCDLLAGFAGNLALSFCATGGAYLAGGVSQVLEPFIESAAVRLRRRFEDRGRLTDYARAIPLLLMRDADPGLRGAGNILRARQEAPP
jgi:glucokinase